MEPALQAYAASVASHAHSDFYPKLLFRAFGSSFPNANALSNLKAWTLLAGQDQQQKLASALLHFCEWFYTTHHQFLPYQFFEALGIAHVTEKELQRIIDFPLEMGHVKSTKYWRFKAIAFHLILVEPSLDSLAHISKESLKQHAKSKCPITRQCFSELLTWPNIPSVGPVLSNDPLRALDPTTCYRLVKGTSLEIIGRTILPKTLTNSFWVTKAALLTAAHAST